MKSRRYLWRGNLLYVALVHGKWAVVHDGRCGEPSVVVNKDVRPEASRELAQKRLEGWALKEGLEEWKP